MVAAPQRIIAHHVQASRYLTQAGHRLGPSAEVGKIADPGEMMWCCLNESGARLGQPGPEAGRAWAWETRYASGTCSSEFLSLGMCSYQGFSLIWYHGSMPQTTDG